MELAGAFEGVDSELRDMLRDAAAREEKDAEALGEIEATRLRAEGRISELDTALKAKVDSGELPAVRLPAAQRAAALRTGSEHAMVGLQTELLSRIPEAVKAGPGGVDRIIAESFQKFDRSIAPGAFYERKGFDSAAREVLTNFRQRVTQEQTAEAERYQTTKRADEGVDLVYQLATAPEDLSGPARDRVKLYLDAIRGEMKKSEVNSFFAESVLKGTVARLVEEKNFTGAEQLLEEVKAIDLTGKGGLFSKTEVGSKALYELSNLVDAKRRTARSSDAESMREALFIAETLGTTEAAKDLYTLKQANGGMLPSADRQRLIIEAQGRISDPLAFQRYTAVINAEFENDERWKADPMAAARLVTASDTLDPKQLDGVETQLELALTNKEISASVYHEVKQAVTRNKQLVAQIQDSDVEAFARGVFQVRSDFGKGFTIEVGDPDLTEAWQDIDEDKRTAIRVESADFFVGQFREQIRMLSQGNPAAVPAIKTQAFDKASNAARTFAKSRVAVAAKGISKEVQEQTVAKQAQNIRQAERIFPGKSFFRRAIETIGEAQMVSLPPSLPTTQGKEQGTESPKPRNLKETLEKQKALPASEWDVVPLPPVVVKALFRGSEIKRNAVDLGDMAQRADNEEARRYYGVAKSVAGFTPEEIKAEKTKHGVTFNAALIDPKSVTVFRSVAELNKHWQEGQPDEVFLETGDAVDPRHTLTTQEFYLAQLALLSRK